MKLSFNNLKTEWSELIEGLATHTTWKDDLVRGLKALVSGGAFIADRSLTGVEMMRFRHQLEALEEKLSLAYQALGKKSMEHWNHQQDLDEKEKIKALRQISSIINEKEKVLEEIKASKMTSQPLSTPEKTSE